MLSFLSRLLILTILFEHRSQGSMFACVLGVLKLQACGCLLNNDHDSQVSCSACPGSIEGCNLYIDSTCISDVLSPRHLLGNTLFSRCLAPGQVE